MGAVSLEIAKARDTLQDEDNTSYRTSTAKFVGYANDFVRELAVLRPDLFANSGGEITCTAGTVLQSAPATSIVLIDIFQVKNGRVVREVSRDALDALSPNWMNDTAAAAKNWMRLKKDPRKYLIYPKAPVSQILIGQWAELPAAMVDENSQVPAQVLEAYYPALHHYMVYRVETKDDESAVSGRAKLFYEGYAALMGLGKASKAESETPARKAPGGQ